MWEEQRGEGDDENGMFNAGVERSRLGGLPGADLAG